MSKKEIESIALKLQNRLLAEGFVVQRYDAYTTNSVYLKLDYGVCNSIRISDHRGKQKLNYMFNLDKNAKEIKTVKEDFTRYYYPFGELAAMIRHILHHRTTKQQRYGENYHLVVEQSKRQNQNNAGFWREAKTFLPAERTEVTG